MSEEVDKTDVAAVAAPEKTTVIEQEEENDLLSGEDDLNFEAGHKNIVVHEIFLN